MGMSFLAKFFRLRREGMFELPLCVSALRIAAIILGGDKFR